MKRACHVSFFSSDLSSFFAKQVVGIYIARRLSVGDSKNKPSCIEMQHLSIETPLESQCKTEREERKNQSKVVLELTL